MSKSKEYAANKPISQADALVKSCLKETLDLFSKYNESDEPLIDVPIRPDNARSIFLPCELPPQAFKPPDWSDEEEYYLPGERELKESGEYTFISFADMEHYIDNDVFNLGRTAILIKTLFSNEPLSVYLSGYADCRFVADVHVGSIGNNPPRAFLNAACEDGKWCFIELEEFCVLSVIDEAVNSEEGIFTYFNKKDGILSTGFIIGGLSFKDYKLKGKPYPKAPEIKAVNALTKSLVRDCFGDLTGRYAKYLTTNSTRIPKTTPQSSGEAVPFHSLQLDKQQSTQEQMRRLCKLIRSRGQRRHEVDNYTEINLQDLQVTSIFTSDKDLPYLDICVKPVGDTVQRIILREGNRLDAAIIAGSPDGGSYLAFLVIKREDGEYIFELESFRILSINYKREDEHYGVFVAFNSFPNMLHRDHCIAYPKPKLYLLDLKTEPNPDGGDTED